MHKLISLEEDFIDWLLSATTLNVEECAKLKREVLGTEELTMPEPLFDENRLLFSLIRPTLEVYGPFEDEDQEAECMLVAIAIQETDLTYLFQVGADGVPLYTLARGLWQFEKPAIDLVLKHSSCCWFVDRLEEIGFANADAYQIHQALPAHYELATLLARANLWWHSQPLPAVSLAAEDQAWDYYIDCWNPGKPHREKWTDAWARAVAVMEFPVA